MGVLKRTGKERGQVDGEEYPEQAWTSAALYRTWLIGPGGFPMKPLGVGGGEGGKAMTLCL